MKAGLVLALLAGLAARSAQAQTFVQTENRFRSPQHWALELRFGPYSPDVDAEFKGGADPHKQYFSNKHHLMFQVELDYQFFHRFGSAAVSAQAGYFHEQAKAKDLAGNSSGDSTGLLLVPTALQLVYRMDEASRRLSIPLVPYAKLGLNYTIWRVTDANGDTARASDGKKGLGGTPGWQAAAGVALLLDFIDAGSSRALDSETGVNHTYVFAEVARYEASGLGRKNALHVGDSTWSVGLMFEF
jgi:hypothetical protein